MVDLVDLLGVRRQRFIGFEDQTLRDPNHYRNNLDDGLPLYPSLILKKDGHSKLHHIDKLIEFVS